MEYACNTEHACNICDACLSDCVFCNAVGVKTEYHIIMKDKYPITKGHLLIIPKRHIETVDDYSDDELKDLRTAIREAKELFGWCEVTVDYNIGVNDGVDAGQTIKHLHWHIIPRTENDGGKPCGIRNVFPEKADYTTAVSETDEHEEPVNHYYTGNY